MELKTNKPSPKLSSLGFTQRDAHHKPWLFNKDGTPTDSACKVLHPPWCSRGHYSVVTKHLCDVRDSCLAGKCLLNFVDRKTKSKEGKSFTVTSKTTGGVDVEKNHWFLPPHRPGFCALPHATPLHLYLAKVLRPLPIYHICFSLSLNGSIADSYSSWNKVNIDFITKQR